MGLNQADYRAQGESDGGSFAVKHPAIHQLQSDSADANGNGLQ